jgi:hypothetical protein
MDLGGQFLNPTIRKADRARLQASEVARQLTAGYSLQCPAMNYSSCPTNIVNAPVELVWTLLTRPEEWGAFCDVGVTGVDPAGPARVGQTVFAESGPQWLHLKLEFRFTEIDALNYKLGLDAQFPFGVTVQENLACIPLGPEQCRVVYNCGFEFPAGWRGAMLHYFLRRRLDAGPADSLSRLKRQAERLHAESMHKPSFYGSEPQDEPID